MKSCSLPFKALVSHFNRKWPNSLTSLSFFKEQSLIQKRLFYSLPKGKVSDSGHCILANNICNLAKKETCLFSFYDLLISPRMTTSLHTVCIVNRAQESSLKKIIKQWNSIKRFIFELLTFIKLVLKVNNFDRTPRLLLFETT